MNTYKKNSGRSQMRKQNIAISRAKIATLLIVVNEMEIPEIENPYVLCRVLYICGAPFPVT